MTGSQSEDHHLSIYQLKQYQLLLKSVASHAIFRIDTSGRIETWNRGGETIFGYTADEIINQHFSLLYPEHKTNEHIYDQLLKKAKQDSSAESEAWHLKKDGSRFWAQDSVTALFNEQNTLIGYALITADITTKKRHQDALIAANKLFKYQRVELEALSNIKDEFISLASHQLRTPATGIKQFLGLLLEGYGGTLSPQQIAYIQKAYASNERQITLVNNLLRTAQVDAGKVKLTKSVTDIRLIVEDIVEELKDSFGERQQTVKIVADDDLEDYYLDYPRMRMVLENLIDNASKYTDIGGRITICLSHQKNRDTITIKDTGVGIAGNDIEQIFEKFNRVANALSDSADGTGLGLYWAKKIVELHKGTINVSSEIGVGSEFTISLPKGPQHG